MDVDVECFDATDEMWMASTWCCSWMTMATSLFIVHEAGKNNLRVTHCCAGDAIRPFLLDAYGGLYMDVDVECFDATDEMVDGFDLVLQLEDNGNKSLNNAVMAGAPGLAIWDNMQHLLKDRWDA